MEQPPIPPVAGNSRGPTRGHSDPPAGGPVDRRDRVDRADRFILPFVREPMLWPVLAVGVGHAAVFIAVAILEGLRDRNPIGWLALAALALFSLRVPAYEVGRGHRPGALSALTAVAWLLATGLAAVAHHYGAY